MPFEHPNSFSLFQQRLNWALQIHRVSPEDAGLYECQATTHPPQSIVIRFRVVGEYYIRQLHVGLRGLPWGVERGPYILFMEKSDKKVEEPPCFPLPRKVGRMAFTFFQPQLKQKMERALLGRVEKVRLVASWQRNRTKTAQSWLPSSLTPEEIERKKAGRRDGGKVVRFSPAGKR